MTAPRLHTAAQAEALLNLPRRHLERRATAGAVPHTRVGRYIRFSDADLDAIIAAGQVTPARLRRAS